MTELSGPYSTAEDGTVRPGSIRALAAPHSSNLNPLLALRSAFVLAYMI